MKVEGYSHFGGRHGESAAIKNTLAHAGVSNPCTGQPFSEALCFGIAGGIGAGYSFCPAIIRYGAGSGVSVVGRHLAYASDASWYQGFFDRLGIRTRITETTGTAKAHQNLVGELEKGRPVIVWCSTSRLPFLSPLRTKCDLWMHSFVVFAIDEAKGQAWGGDRAPTRVTLSLEELAEARDGVCSHKNRTLTFEPPARITTETLQSAVRAGIRACAKGMLEPKIKTFGLPALESWAKRIDNRTSKEGWPHIFQNGLLYCALRDVYDGIETAGTGGGLFRGMYADFLDEAAGILQDKSLTDQASTYRQLGQQWSDLAEAALPSAIKPFKQTRDLLTKKKRLYEEKGEKAARQIGEATAKLRGLESTLRAVPPLDAKESSELLSGLRERITALHAAETRAADQLV